MSRNKDIHHDGTKDGKEGAEAASPDLPSRRPCLYTLPMLTEPMPTDVHTALVVIPTCNAAAFLDRTLASVAASIAHHCRRSGAAPDRFLTVVVDDASTDGTVAVAEGWRDRLSLMILGNAERRGTSFSRNRGAAAAAAAVLFFLDHDDEFLPEHLDVCLRGLDQRPDAAYVRTGVELTVPVHPAWLPVIASHLPITLGVRQDCHALLGGFNEDPAVRVLRCEDVLYANLLDGFFHGLRTDVVTARHHHMPGNALDNQLERFRQPPGAVPPTPMKPEETEARRQVEASHRRQAERVGQRFATLLRTMKPVAAPVSSGQ